MFSKTPQIRAIENKETSDGCSMARLPLRRNPHGMARRLRMERKLPGSISCFQRLLRIMRRVTIAVSLYSGPNPINFGTIARVPVSTPFEHAR